MSRDDSPQTVFRPLSRQERAELRRLLSTALADDQPARPTRAEAAASLATAFDHAWAGANGNPPPVPPPADPKAPKSPPVDPGTKRAAAAGVIRGLAQKGRR